MELSRRTYLDFNATAPLRATAREAMLAAMDSGVANPSSVHAEGRAARALIDAAREQVAALCGAKTTEVVFTSGATEAANWVLGAPWSTIYSANIEHPAVLNPIASSQARHIALPIDANGLIDVGQTERLLKADADKTGQRPLLVVQGANNETGVIQPLASLVGVANEVGAKVLTDCVQLIGKEVVDFSNLGTHFMMVSGHKIGGPPGVGALIVREDINLVTRMKGGGQERNRRGGTENVPGIAGFGAAADAARSELRGFSAIRKLRDRLETFSISNGENVVAIAAGAPRLGNTSCLAIPGSRGETTVIKFDLAGVSISAGSACSSGKTDRAQTLEAIGLNEELTDSAIRVSLGWSTTEKDIEAFEQTWLKIFSSMRNVRNVA